MKTVILIILWIIFDLLGISSMQSHNFGLFLISGLFIVILSILLFFSILGSVSEIIGKTVAPKRKYREVNSMDKEEYYRDPQTEHIILNNPEYIGILTKIDKKRIAEEYLEGLKKDKKDGKN